MARKSKIKRASGKKKTGRRKGKRRGSNLDLVQGIGVVSTIFLSREMKDEFRAGVADPTVVIKFRHVGSYKKNKLKKKIARFNRDPAIGLIVTAGGSKTYEVAKTDATKPFISLVGVEPANPPDLCHGGMTLNSVEKNPDRVDYMHMQKGKSKLDIALVHNPNSAMAAKELANWATLNAGPVIAAGKDATADENDSSTYEDAFGKDMPANVTAVVISADPFFQETMDELVDEANKSARFICYPLQDYFDASPRPLQGNATLFGPGLKASYKTLGVRAKTVLTTGNKLQPLFDPAANVITPL
jgi:hypothetical protein